MTKDYCDLCLKEIKDESATVRIQAEHMYDGHDYCLSCFLDRSKWKKIHVIPGKQFSRSYQVTK